MHSTFGVESYSVSHLNLYFKNNPGEKGADDNK